MSRSRGRTQGLIATICAALFAVPAAALEFNVGGVPIRMDNLVSVGAMMRMQDRNDEIIARNNLQPGLCVSRDANGTEHGDVCGTNTAGANQRYLDAEGGFNINGDQGNLNFDKGDLTFATAKLTTDLGTDLFDFHIFARGVYFHDFINNGHVKDKHPDTTFQPAETEQPSAVRHRIGDRFDILDLNVSRAFAIGDRNFAIKVGRQVINWGESSFLVFNSLNVINPPDATRLRLPGADIKEVFRPVGMAVADADLIQNVHLQAFYQYDWKPVIVDPVGSFFSTSDTLGDGGRYTMLGFGKPPEDPEDQYRPYLNTVVQHPGDGTTEDGAGLLGARQGSTIYRNYNEEAKRAPRNTGQYGFALKTFLESINNGTDLTFYYANYHSRIPSVSVIAAQATCIPAPSFIPGTTTQDPVANLANYAVACGYNGPGMPATGNPLPTDTMSLFAEYPENIHMFGVSFNTTVGDFAWSGEYVYRPNLPIQINTVDLIFAGLQPALPRQDYSLQAATIPGRRTGLPDFMMQYRNPGCEPDCVTPGQYIAGFERMKIGELGTTLLKTIGGSNPIGASQITLLAEAGMTHVIGMPAFDKLQFVGGNVETHPSTGADGSWGVNPVDVRTDPNDPSTNRNRVTDPAGTALLQNPQAEGRGNFGTRFSWGYRFVNLNRWDSLLFGANIESLFGFFHDVNGTAPGLGQNFIQGRKQILAGIRFDYLSKWQGEIRYTWYCAGGDRDNLTDRDNLFVSLGYQF